MSSSTETPQAPSGHFFRVCPPDRDGDILISLRRRLPDGWFRKNKSVCVDYVYILQRRVVNGLEIEVPRAMNILLTRYQAKQYMAGFVGDYPPKRL